MPSFAHNVVTDHEGDHAHAIGGTTTALAIGAIGVVFGDIGTSPLYALKETFAGHHPLPIDILHVFGVLSLIFWSFLIIVTFKYVTIVMNADNKGEGGSLALLALITRKIPGERGWLLTMLAVLATALFFGDAIITPSISVLSAVEGLVVVEASMEPLVLPNSIAPIMVLTSLSVGAMITAESALTFLGVGLRTPSISWGVQLNLAQDQFRTHLHLLLFPSLFLTITVLAFVFQLNAEAGGSAPTLPPVDVPPGARFDENGLAA